MEWSESGSKFQILGAAEWKQRELKIRLVLGTCKRLEEDDLRTQGQYGIRRCER